MSGEEGVVSVFVSLLVLVLGFAVMGDVGADVVFELVGISGEVGEEVEVEVEVEVEAEIVVVVELAVEVEVDVTVEARPAAPTRAMTSGQVEENPPVARSVGEQATDSSRALTARKKAFRPSSPRSRSSFNSNRSLLSSAYRAIFSSMTATSWAPFRSFLSASRSCECFASRS